MKILLYGINYAPELTGIGKYSGEMMAWLAEQGHDVRVVTVPPYYPQWEIQPPYSKWKFRKEQLEGVTVIRCPLYVPKKPTTIKRLLHLLDFALSGTLGLLSQLRFRPDVVMVVEPTLFCVPSALVYAKLSGAKTWLHIQDFELDAMFGLGMAKGGGLKQLAMKVESWLMRRFDRVSSISSSMLALAEQKGVAADSIRFFPNWSDMQHIFPMEDKRFRSQWQIPENSLVVLYSGNIGKKQGLEIVVEAARYYQQRDDIYFVVVGDGAHKEALMTEAQGLPNLLFKPLQPLEELNALLAMADIHLVVQKAGAADLVLPSKLTNILAAGGYSIITADKGTALGDFCEQYPGIATRVDAENTAQFMQALEQQLNDARQRPGLNKPAREYAEQYLEKSAILRKFELDVSGLMHN